LLHSIKNRKKILLERENKKRVMIENIEIGKKYFISIQFGNRILVFTGVIKSIENNFVCFIDKFGIKKTFNLANCISFEEREVENE